MFKYLVFLNVINLIGSKRPDFRTDYQYEKAFNAFYKLHKISAKWEEAYIRCEAESGKLMWPDTLDEADCISTILTKVHRDYAGVFVGIHDMYSEGTFVTINGSAVLTSILDLLWEYRQPQRGAGRCVAMRRSGKLFVQPCDHPLPYVCKVPASDISHNSQCNTYNSGWKMSGATDKCYISHAEPQIWHHAYATCFASGGRLAIINSRKEAEEIKDLFKEIHHGRVPDNEFAFLGFSDLFRRHHYRTIKGDSLEEAGYANWEGKCLSDAANSSSNRRCGGIRRSSQLATGNCDVPAIFFCEITVRSNTSATTKSDLVTAAPTTSATSKPER